MITVWKQLGNDFSKQLQYTEDKQKGEMKHA
jgi:hypothetical protein